MLKHTLRLTRRDTQLIHFGVRRLVGAYIVWRDHQQTPNAPPDITSRRPAFDRGEFEESFMPGVLEIWPRIQEKYYTGGRFRVDVWQTSAFALAARVAGTWVRHGHQLHWFRRFWSALKHLLKKLEVHRKRLKRALLKDSGPEKYREQARRWERHVRWMRLHLLGCPCTRKLSQRGIYQLHMNVLKRCLEIATRELQSQAVTMPPEKDIRRLLRLALHYTRRGRTPFSIPQLLNHPQRSGPWLASFILTRVKALARTPTTHN